jgi:hypothetical protein
MDRPFGAISRFGEIGHVATAVVQNNAPLA